MAEQTMKRRESTPTEDLMGARVQYLIDLHFEGHPTRLAKFLDVPYLTVWRWTIYGCKARTRNLEKLEKLRGLDFDPGFLLNASQATPSRAESKRIEEYFCNVEKL